MPNQSARVIERQAEARLHRYTPAMMVLYFIVFVYTGVVGAVWVALRTRKSFQITTGLP